MSKTSIRPCGHAVLIERLKVVNETSWGFITVASTKTERMERGGREIGVIVAVGPQAWKAHAVALADHDRKRYRAGEEALEPWAKVGDLVFYSRYAGREVLDPVEEKVLYLVHDEDVKAVLPPQSEWKVDILNPQVQEKLYKEADNDE